MNTTMAANKPSQPWFRQFWPWFLLALPGTVVVAGFITAWIAFKTDDGLVVDDYYKHGLTLQQSIVRDREATRRGLSASVRISGGQASLVLSSTDGVLPASLFLTLSHPTRPDEDRALSLVGENGHYTAAIDAPDGRWNVLLEDESRAWRLIGTIDLPSETELRLAAQPPVN